LGTEGGLSRDYVALNIPTSHGNHAAQTDLDLPVVGAESLQGGRGAHARPEQLQCRSASTQQAQEVYGFGPQHHLDRHGTVDYDKAPVAVTASASR
jgi:hypothetical protein